MRRSSQATRAGPHGTDARWVRDPFSGETSDGGEWPRRKPTILRILRRNSALVVRKEIVPFPVEPLERFGQRSGTQDLAIAHD